MPLPILWYAFIAQQTGHGLISYSVTGVITLPDGQSRCTDSTKIEGTGIVCG